MTYEIHMGITKLIDAMESEQIKPLLQAQYHNEEIFDEGIRSDRVWGCYLHGLFESAYVRQALTQLANISEHLPSSISWQDHQQKLYNSMADMLEEHLDLTSIRHYLEF